MSYCWPASKSFSQRARPWRAGTLTSKPSSPVKETRKSRVGQAGDRALGDRHVREGFVAEMSRPSTKGSSSLRAFGPLSAIDRPLLGGRGEPDLEVGPLGLEVVLHHVEDARGAAGRGGDVEAVGGEPADDAVVADEAVLAEQQAVAAAADAELGPGVGVHPLHEGRRRPGRRPRSCRASRRRRCRARRGWRGTRGRPRRACPRRALREVPGAAPERDRLEDRAVGLGPGVDRRLARHLERLPLVVAGEGAEGRRRVGRAEGGQADLRRRRLPSASAAIIRPLMFDILPWSVAMPLVV